MSQRLFGSSGIRGLVNIEITPLLVQRIGAALATLVEGGEFVVGHDTRVSGPMLESSLIAGLTSCGGDVSSIGLLPTPVIAWLTRELQKDIGIAISASHNPPEYNGLKIFNKYGMSLTTKEQKNLESILKSNKFNVATWESVGNFEKLDASGMYIDTLIENIALKKDWKVSCDLYSGAANSILPTAFSALGLHATLINANPDGYFSAGQPEPTVENLSRLGSFVKASHLDIGFGFDGDADRMMAVDDTGTPVSGDRLLAAYAGFVIDSNGGGNVVTNIGASMCIDDVVEAAGGKVIRTPVGDSFITEEMQKQKAIFGGEPIGAWILPEINMCPDGILSAFKLLEALEVKDLKLSEFVAKVPEYPILSTKIDSSSKTKVMKKIQRNYDQIFKEVKSVNRTDGIRLQLEEGWILIRASGTEPIIRITAEGLDSQNARNILADGVELVKKMGATN